MRITNQTLYRDSSAAIESTTEQLLEAQRQVASGKRIEKPSDDPSAMSSAIIERSELAATEEYQRTADSANSRMTVIDTALSDIIERLSQGQTAAVAGRGSTKTQEQREAAAQTLEGVKQAILEDLNTSFHGAYVFAGTDSMAPPFVAGAGGVVSAYQGSTQQMTVDIAQGRSVAVGLDGSAVSQGGAATTLFADLDSLIAAVRAGNEPAITQGIASLDAAFNRATAMQTRVGTQLANIETTQSQLTDRRVSVKARISKYEDANMAEAIANMKQADAAYNAALAATARIGQKSLMDYLS